MSGFGYSIFGFDPFGFGGSLPTELSVDDYAKVFDWENLGIDLLLDETGEMLLESNGDLLVTSSGRTSLMQDVKHILETIPSDLLGHTEYGSGIGRLFGENKTKQNVDLVIRCIEDALVFSSAVAPRIQKDSVKITYTYSNRTLTFYIDFKAIDQELTTPINMVWAFNADSSSFGET